MRPRRYPSSSSADHSPPSRRVGLAQAVAGERRAPPRRPPRAAGRTTISAPAAASSARRRRAAAAGRGWRRRSAPTGPRRAAGRARSTAIPGTPLTAAFARVASTEAASQSHASTGSQPSRAAAIASTPAAAAPVGERAVRLELEQQLEAQPRRVVRAGPERLAGVDHQVDAVAASGALPRRPDAQPAEAPAHVDRPVERLPALRPVVGDLARSRRRRARRPRRRARPAAPAARPARRRSRTRPRRRRLALLEPAGRELEQLGEHRLGVARARRGRRAGSCRLQHDRRPLAAHPALATRRSPCRANASATSSARAAGRRRRSAAPAARRAARGDRGQQVEREVARRRSAPTAAASRARLAACVRSRPRRWRRRCARSPRAASGIDLDRVDRPEAEPRRARRRGRRCRRPSRTARRRPRARAAARGRAGSSGACRRRTARRGRSRSRAVAVAARRLPRRPDPQPPRAAGHLDRRVELVPAALPAGRDVASASRRPARRRRARAASSSAGSSAARRVERRTRPRPSSARSPRRRRAAAAAARRAPTSACSRRTRIAEPARAGGPRHPARVTALELGEHALVLRAGCRPSSESASRSSRSRCSRLSLRGMTTLTCTCRSPVRPRCSGGRPRARSVIDLARLGAGGDLDRDVAVEARHLHRRAERRERGGDVDHRVEVLLRRARSARPRARGRRT